MSARGTKKSRQGKGNRDLFQQRTKISPVLLSYENEPPLMVAERMLVQNSGSLVWRKHHLGISIQQLFPDLYCDVIQLLRQDTTKCDPLCLALEIDKLWEPKEEMIAYGRDWLKNCTSLVAVDELNGRVYGTIVGRIVNSERLLREMEQLKNSDLQQPAVTRARRPGKKVITNSGVKRSSKNTPVNGKKMKNIKKVEKENGRKPKAKAKVKLRRKGRRRSLLNEPKGMGKSTANVLRSYIEIPEAEEKGKTVKNKSQTKKDSFAKGGSSSVEVMKVPAPVDIIPIEEKVAKPISVFDDSHQGYESEVLTEFLKFRYDLFGSLNVFKWNKIKCYYKMYVWAVEKEFQNKGLGSELLDAAIAMCTELQIPLILSVFTSVSSQIVADKLNFIPISRFCYDYILDSRTVPNEKYAMLMLRFIDVPVIDTYIKSSIIPAEEIAKKDEERKGKKNKKPSEKRKKKEELKHN